MITVNDVSLKAFRGIPELQLPILGKNLVIVGPNGSGKSCIVDAFEFLFQGTISHLKGTDISLKKNLNHIKADPKKVSVELELSNKDRVARTLKDNPEIASLSNETALYFKNAAATTFILRRAELLTFILTAPGDRFKAISQLIGLNELDAIEKDFKHLHDTMKSEFHAREENITKKYENLSRLLNQKINSDADLVLAMNTTLKQNSLTTIHSLRETESVRTAIHERLRQTRGEISQEAIQQREALETCKRVLQHLPTSEEIQGLIENYRVKCQEELDAGQVEEERVMDFLMKGAQILEARTATHCPFCRQPIERDECLGQVQQRIAQYRDLQSQLNEFNEFCTQTRRSFRNLSDNLGNLSNKLTNIDEMQNKSQFQSELTTLLAEIQAFTYTVEAKRVLTDTESIFREHLDTVIHRIQQEVDQIQQKWHSSQQAEQGAFSPEILLKIDSICQEMGDLPALQQERIEYEKKAEVTGVMYHTFLDVKRQKVQEIYTGIQAKIQQYYDFLHPGENMANIQLTVDQKKRASTNLTMNFYEVKNQNPLAYNSESHLDSLGLCIFLAFVKNFQTQFNLIILDDIMTSIDGQHRQNVARLLFQEFSDKQFVITTHDEIWADQLKGLQRSERCEGKFLNLRITKWDENTGPKFEQLLTKKEKIEQKLADGDRTAGNDIRIYLESILKRLCNELMAPIPYKMKEEYTVGELLDSFDSRMIYLLDPGYLRDTFQKALNNLRATVFMGNLLSHDNVDGASLSIEEIKAFADAVFQIETTFQCPKCNKTMKYSKDLRLIKCATPSCPCPSQASTKKG